MPNYKCKTCEFQTQIKPHLTRHLNRKNKCYDRNDGLIEEFGIIEKTKRPANQDMQSLDEANKKIVSLEEQISALETELDAVALTADDASKMMDALEERDKLRIQNAENEARIKELEAETAEKDDDIEKIIENRDAVIAAYKERIRKYKERLKQSDDAVKKEPVKQTAKILFV
jgi:uncharacterized coiled-coil protein SlyX